jgi:hypothetical protein
LGKVDNQDLLAEIVRVYGQAKGLEGALNFNHQRCALWANLQDNLPTSDSAQSSQDRLLRERLDNLTKELVAMKRNIAGDLQTLLLDLNQVLGNLAACLASEKIQ